MGLPGGSTAQNLSAMQETWVQSLGQEDPLEKGKVTHFSFLALENPMNRGPWWSTIHRVANDLENKQ